jgi:hypothetical protein
MVTFDILNSALIGCLYDPALAAPGTRASECRVMCSETRAAPCGEPLPEGAACLCDCVGGSKTFEAGGVCVCDAISSPAGLKGENIQCVCHTISTGTMTRPATPPCGCHSHVSAPSGGHYWRPN